MVLNGNSSSTRLENVLLSAIGATVKLVLYFSEIKIACNNFSFEKTKLEILEVSFFDIILLSVDNFVQTATNGKSVNFLTPNNAGIVKFEPNSVCLS